MAVVSVDQRFKDDFNLVMEFAGCTKEEAKFEKERVMKDYYNASRCYSVLAAGIRGINK